MKKAPESCRVTTGKKATDPSYGNNGVFVVPHYKISNYYFQVVISDGAGWEHASITLIKEERKVTKYYKNKYGIVGNPGGVQQHRKVEGSFEPVERCPTWEEMCFMKSIFWNEDEAVIQIHPPKSDYVNEHLFCLHLWKPYVSIPLPDPILVGHLNKEA